MKRIILLSLSVLVTLIAISSFKKNENKYVKTYTISDYYQWDAYASYDKHDTGKWEPNSSCWKFTRNGGAQATQSCKNCFTREQMMMYLGAGVYWDEKGPKYTIIYPEDGSLDTLYIRKNIHEEFTSGLWIKKSSKIAGFKENTAKKKDKVSLNDGTNLFKVGKPKNTSDYFFLPAVSSYLNLKFNTLGGVEGVYWLSTSDNKGAHFFSFTKDKALVLSGHDCWGIVPLNGE
jgi:hypothetical protein